jgi:hypothetical protein
VRQVLPASMAFRGRAVLCRYFVSGLDRCTASSWAKPAQGDQNICLFENDEHETAIPLAAVLAETLRSPNSCLGTPALIPKQEFGNEGQVDLRCSKLRRVTELPRVARASRTPIPWRSGQKLEIGTYNPFLPSLPTVGYSRLHFLPFRIPSKSE